MLSAQHHEYVSQVDSNTERITNGQFCQFTCTDGYSLYRYEDASITGPFASSVKAECYKRSSDPAPLWRFRYSSGKDNRCLVSENDKILNSDELAQIKSELASNGLDSARSLYQTLLVSGTQPPVIDSCPEVHNSCTTNSACLRIAAWNIKVFGNSKISNQPVVDIILQVIYQYDLIVIQELKDSSLDCEDPLNYQISR